MPNKPKVILQLEKDLGFELEQVELGRIWTWEREKLIGFSLSSIGQVIGLRLTGCEIKNLNLLKNLNALTDLNLRGNQISDLNFLENLTNLINLDLNSNKINEISPLQGLTALTQLSLSENQISDLSPLQDLTALTRLNLWWNQIIDLSQLKGLTALTELYLRDNQISDPSPLQGLTALTWLDLQNNQIQEITLDFLNHFQKLIELKLYGNPIKNIPEEIFNRKYKDVLTPVRHYLEDLEKQQIQTYQAKVILIGNGRVGKTCLLKRWLDKTFDEKEPSTHAIQLRHYCPEKLCKNNGNAGFLKSILNKILNLFHIKNESRDIQFHIWDFGGQDIYHATHRLFMKTKAIFVLVWDAQTEKEPEQKEADHSYRNYPLNYWLDYAKNLGKNSPILIVQTKKQRDGEQIPKNLAELRQNYNIIASIAVESSQDKHNGFTFFEQHLMEQVEKLLEKTCTVFPKSWWDVQIQLQKWQTSKKTLSLTEFNKLCQKFGLDNEHASSVLSYLHHSGVVFYQENLFQNQIILDQKWAIDAVYTLFDRSGIFLRLARTGEFDTGDLQQVWNDYSEIEQALFLNFMKSCEICFELDYDSEKPFSERRFIAPALLPEEKPKPSNLWLNAQKWFVRYQYRFLHYGNLQSFIVRTHQWAERASLWKNGCELDDDQGNSALIEGFFNTEKPYLQIMVTGNNPQNLLDKVRNEFDEIQQDDQVEECWSLNGEDFVRRIDVESASKQNRQIQAINGVWVDIEGFKLFLQKNDKERFMSEIKIFVSYASQDRQLRQLLVDGLTRHLSHRADFTYNFWTDKDIVLGDDWQEEIDNSLKDTQAALLLVSASFAASGFIKENELPVFFQRKKEEGYCIMPVLVREFDFGHFEKISKIQFFKPYHGDYEYTNPAIQHTVMPFDKIAEYKDIPDGIRERYYKNLAAEIDKMVRKKFTKKI
ncbi:COR domain-containing protein [Thioflexithrix psekupsensis]|uniref:TIR domain-containing protein n=1 Tax=Thioflexithrix psekupsensis TaxID=1570016 RepID=A0A251X6T7_9GAMM|nr:COR domain-containing protein [Thioflexithrix psekupsensis]OUD13050.1 hypothetical protein TPSD3_10380 [Thioflexithrix psekupsensis]